MSAQCCNHEETTQKPTRDYGRVLWIALGAVQG